jgi:hypothetical protein
MSKSVPIVNGSTIDRRVTFGVGTVGNVQALLMCLSSVLNGTLLPARIIVRSEGPFPAFANFYLEQLAEVARIKGVEFLVATIKSKGARAGCDWLMDECKTELFWLGDDDVIYEPQALEAFVEAVTAIAPRVKRWGFIVGNKRDVNNRRNYGDFSQEEINPATLRDYDSTNLFYGYARTDLYPECVALDSGHVLFNMEVLRHSGLRFNAFGTDFNSGGYDTLLGMRCTQAGLTGFFAHLSKSWHLEKEKQNFGEFQQRKAYLTRAAETLNLDKELLQKVFKWV